MSAYTVALRCGEVPRCKTCIYFDNRLFEMSNHGIIGSAIPRIKLKEIEGIGDVGCCIYNPLSIQGWPLVHDSKLAFCAKWEPKVIQVTEEDKHWRNQGETNDGR